MNESLRLFLNRIYQFWEYQFFANKQCPVCCCRPMDQHERDCMMIELRNILAPAPQQIADAVINCDWEKLS